MATVFVHTIAQVEHAKLKELVESADFISLIVDGATDSSRQEAEICYLQCCTKGKIHTHLVGLKNVGKENAKNIAKAMMQLGDELIVNKQWQTKIVGFGTKMDG